MAPVDDLDIVPAPDFERFRKVVLRDGEPDRVPFFELFFDKPMKDHLLEKECSFHLLIPFPDSEKMVLNDIELWYRLGFDYAAFMPFIIFGDSFKTARDMAPIKGAVRFWLKEDKGAELADRHYFEAHNWPDPEAVDLALVEFGIANLPDGMGALIQLPGVVETATWLMGYENLGIASVEDPELVGMVFDKVGSTLLRLTERIFELDGVGGINHGDDMGHKTATLLSPKMMRDYAFDWHKKIADLCHENDALYILHSCGQVEAVMGDFADRIGVDAKHSFEDIIEPVENVKERWGDRMAILGGVDVDLLSRGADDEVRARVREVVRRCAPGGGYALGSGNSVTNYIDPANYLAMLDEGWKSGVYPISV